MAAVRKRSKMQSIITQFSYEHRRLDKQLSKIRKNTGELAHMLDSLGDKKEQKEKLNFIKKCKKFLTFDEVFRIIILALRKYTK